MNRDNASAVGRVSVESRDQRERQAFRDAALARRAVTGNPVISRVAV